MGDRNSNYRDLKIDRVTRAQMVELMVECSQISEQLNEAHEQVERGGAGQKNLGNVLRVMLRTQAAMLTALCVLIQRQVNIMADIEGSPDERLAHQSEQDEDPDDLG